MIKGIGTDIVQISRISKLFEKQGKRFLKRILSPEEISLIPKGNSGAFIAGRFAAKEALVKAFNNRSINFNEITISNEEDGKPFVTDHNGISQYGSNDWNIIHISISHERDYAIAFVIVE